MFKFSSFFCVEKLEHGHLEMVKQFFHAIVWTERHLTGQYDIREVSIAASFIRPDEICLDIGAHAGSWTRPLSKLVERGHVIAIEALPYYANVLKLAVRLLRLKNVSVINQAVTDHSNPVALIWRDSNGKRLTGLTHVAVLAEDTKDAIIVNSTTLDAFLTSHNFRARVAFVKADVEGGELMVVHGAVKMIEKFRPVFYLEVQADHCRRYGYKPSDLFDFFELRKYSSYTISGSDLFITEKRTYSGKGDVLFVPTEKRYSFDIITE